MKIFNQKQINEAACILKDGGLIAFPTETVFGFGVIYDNHESYKRLIDVKRRPPEKPFTLMLSDIEDIDKAIELCLFVMKTQIYNDGNKRTAVIFANHYLISKGKGLLVIDYNKVSEFKKHLVAYYEDRDLTTIKTFLKNCWIKF